MVMEMAAFTPFLWMMKGRDMIYDVFEEECGARITGSDVQQAPEAQA